MGAVLKWSTACKDWESRIVKAQTIIPFAPLFHANAVEALDTFDALRMVDAANSPTFGEICRPWIREFVAQIFGAYEDATGIRHITEYFMLISKKNGKALALDTKLPTPTGFTTMGDVQPGDLVLGADGKPTKVLWKGPVYNDHACYRVAFSTGEEIVADAGHLWETETLSSKYERSVKTTAQIAGTLRYSNANNHRVRLTAPVDLPPLPFNVDPYVLGVWLGDGAAATSLISTSEEDCEQMLANLAACGERVSRRLYNGKHHAIRMTHGGLHTRLRQLGVLGNKHVPVKYLRGSIQQRLALLQGLMDSDGTISKAGQASFTNTNKNLVDSVVQLVASLGMKPSIREFEATLNGKSCGSCWDVQFWPAADTPVFRLGRKFARQKMSLGSSSRSKRRHIVACEPIDPVPVQCISVDNADKLFLVGESMIPTHNSTTAAGIMMTALILNWRMEAEFLILSPTKEIADNSFKPAAAMVRADPDLEALFLVQDHLRTITHRVTGASLKVVAADSNTVSGKKAVGVLVDELWLFGKNPRADAMLLEATGGLASRPEGFVIYLTTQSDEPPAGVFKTKLEYARNVRDGIIVDPQFLPVLYEFPTAMVKAKAYLKPENFYITNPNLTNPNDPSDAGSVNVVFLERGWRVAQEEGEAKKRIFLAKHLNVEIGLNLRADRWRGAEHWEAAARLDHVSLDWMIKNCEVITMGIDGGGLDDLLGVAALGRTKCEYEVTIPEHFDEETGEKQPAQTYMTKLWVAWLHAYAHPTVFKQRPDIATKLVDMKKEGTVTVVNYPGEDVAKIGKIVSKIDRAGLLNAVGLDPNMIGSILDAILLEGVDSEKMVKVNQGSRLAGSIKTTERKLWEGVLVHDGNLLGNWMAGNAKVVVRGNGIYITKQVSGLAKIDALIALLNCVALMELNPESMAMGNISDLMVIAG